VCAVELPAVDHGAARAPAPARRQAPTWARVASRRDSQRGPANRPDLDSERRELAARLSAALDELPLAQRAAFVLCEVEERSSVEAAEILGEKPGTVRARVFHAKRRLRERLAELVPEAAQAAAGGAR
jgi:RNA polymerase sigma-70 factor (ECF subfamily)